MRRYYLRDYTYDGDSAAWQDFVISLIGKQPDADNDVIIKSHVCNSQGETETFKERDTIVLVHADTVEGRSKWVSASNEWLKGHVVFVSRPGRLTNQIVVDAAKIARQVDYSRCHACYWSLSQLKDGKIPRVSALLASLKTNKPDFELLQPLAAEHVHALRILCEAWILTEGGNKKLPIPIQTPTDSQLWLRLSEDESVKGVAKDMREAMGTGRLEWPGHRGVVEKLVMALRAESQ